MAISGTVAYLVGSFTEVNGQSRNGIAAVHRDSGLLLPFNPRLEPKSDTKVVVIGNSVYVGGSLKMVGDFTSTSGAWLALTGSGSVALNSPVLDSAVSRMIPDGSGGWYLGGYFTSINGQPRNRLARINSDGSLHAFDPSADNGVLDLLLSGSTLYVAGYFGNVGGQSRSRLAALDTTLDVNNATDWNPSVTGSFVNSIALGGSTLFVGGDFGSLAGQPRLYLGSVLTTGTINNATTWNPSVYRSGASTEVVVKDLILSGSTLFVAGSFGTIGGHPRTNLAALRTNATTNNATTWNPNVNLKVRRMILTGSTLFAGGDFTSAGGQSRMKLAALLTTSTINNATAWAPQVLYDGSSTFAYVEALALNGTMMYVGGFFDSAGTSARSNLAAFNTGGTFATALNVSAAWSVSELFYSGSQLFVSGNFNSIGGIQRGNLAAFDKNTGSILSWDPNAENVVFAMTTDGTKLFVGGQFTKISGTNRTGLAELDPVSAAVTNWKAGVSPAYITALQLSGTLLFVGGAFNTIGGQSRNRIAALVTTSTINNAINWNPGTNGLARAFAPDGTLVYVGGAFSSIGGQTRQNLAALQLTSSLGIATDWNPSPSGPINDLLKVGNLLYVGGGYTFIDGKLVSHLSALKTQGTTNYVTQWFPSPNSAVNVLELFGTTLYAGGTFSSISSTSKVGYAGMCLSVEY